MTTKLYTQLARVIQARSNCIAANPEWLAKHSEKLDYLAKQYLPSGSGFDSGTTLDVDASSNEKLVFNTAYHHMSDSGMYDGWTEHTITLRPSLSHGFELSISGRDRDQIKDYIHEQFKRALDDEQWSVREEYLRQLEVHPSIKVNGRWRDQCTQVWDCLGATFMRYEVAIAHAIAHASHAKAS